MYRSLARRPRLRVSKVSLLLDKGVAALSGTLPLSLGLQLRLNLCIERGDAPGVLFLLLVAFLLLLEVLATLLLGGLGGLFALGTLCWRALVTCVGATVAVGASKIHEESTLHL